MNRMIKKLLYIVTLPILFVCKLPHKSNLTKKRFNQLRLVNRIKLKNNLLIFFFRFFISCHKHFLLLIEMCEIIHLDFNGIYEVSMISWLHT